MHVGCHLNAQRPPTYLGAQQGGRRGGGAHRRGFAGCQCHCLRPVCPPHPKHACAAQRPTSARGAAGLGAGAGERTGAGSPVASAIASSISSCCARSSGEVSAGGVVVGWGWGVVVVVAGGRGGARRQRSAKRRRHGARGPRPPSRRYRRQPLSMHPTNAWWGAQRTRKDPSGRGGGGAGEKVVPRALGPPHVRWAHPLALDPPACATCTSGRCTSGRCSLMYSTADATWRSQSWQGKATVVAAVQGRESRSSVSSAHTERHANRQACMCGGTRLFSHRAGPFAGALCHLCSALPRRACQLAGAGAGLLGAVLGWVTGEGRRQMSL